MHPGIYLLHKPIGATSFSLVQRLREENHAEGRSARLPICHGGTLDPFAQGLLLILAGEATGLMDLIHAAPKVYLAEIAWGAETDNCDPGGRVIAEGDPTKLTPSLLLEALTPFLGWTDQIPPATSAKKVGGEPAYRRVHRGEKVELGPSRVFLHRAQWLEHHLPHSSLLELVCRGGFYVRSMARDLGRALGCRAHLRALRRAAIGPWQDPPPDARVGAHGRKLLPWYASLNLDQQMFRDLRSGKAMPMDRCLEPEWPFPDGFAQPPPLIRAFDRGNLVALLDPHGRPTLRFRQGL